MNNAQYPPLVECHSTRQPGPSDLGGRAPVILEVSTEMGPQNGGSLLKAAMEAHFDKGPVLSPARPMHWAQLNEQGEVTTPGYVLQPAPTHKRPA